MIEYKQNTNSWSADSQSVISAVTQSLKWLANWHGC